MKKKVLWISKEDPHKLIRPNESGITKIDTVLRLVRDPEVSAVTNFRELKDSLSINKDNWFSEICFTKDNIDELHCMDDCIKEVFYFEYDNNLTSALYTIIDATEEDRIKAGLFVEELVNSTSVKEYL